MLFIDRFNYNSLAHMPLTCMVSSSRLFQQLFPQRCVLLMSIWLISFPFAEAKVIALDRFPTASIVLTKVKGRNAYDRSVEQSNILLTLYHAAQRVAQVDGIPMDDAVYLSLIHGYKTSMDSIANLAAIGHDGWAMDRLKYEYDPG